MQEFIQSRCCSPTIMDAKQGILLKRAQYISQLLFMIFVSTSQFYSVNAASVVNNIQLWPSSSFSVSSDKQIPDFQQQGTISFSVTEQLEYQIIEDNQRLLANLKNEITSLPLFNFDVLIADGYIIPIKRGVQRTEHPYWEYLFEPGRVWKYSEQWSKVSLPFALSERNANCTHNGIIDFLINKPGIIKDVRIQIASETCAYLKFNLQGRLNGTFKEKPIQDIQLVRSNFKQELENRLPKFSLKQLSIEFPGVQLSKLQPKDIENTTQYGLLINNKYYASDCPTRAGNYPFCEQLALPSYSLAKTIFAGLSYLYIENHYNDFAATKITEFIPECENNRWKDVTIKHLTDMVSGHFGSSNFMKDESSDDIEEFFLSQTAKEKIGFSCNKYPYQEQPGNTWVYHTSDHFLAGVFMTRFMRDKTKNKKYDLYHDLLYQHILLPLKVSPLLSDSKRTYDNDAQPFVGWGLTLLADDLVKISRFINSYRDNSEASKVFNNSRLQEILSETDLQHENRDLSYFYETGFWRLNLKKNKMCKDNKWLTFMSGYGGISVILFPDNMIYFSFTDGYQFNWHRSAVELNRIHPYCENNY